MNPSKIIIVGASSGIGKELALQYTQANARVGITGRRQQLLDEISAANPEQILTSCFDVTVPGVTAHLNDLIEKLGGLDVFIYCAGYGEINTQLDYTIDKQTTDVNVNGFLEAAHAAWNYFNQQGHGQIVAISSIAALLGNSHAPAYNASKAFVSNYMMGLDIKRRKVNPKIIITDIQPGFVNTEMAKGEGLFWVADPKKAASQIITAIKRKKRKAYITRRWGIIAYLLKHMPYVITRRFG
jgi:short-subunit dehydrogenase